MCDLLWADPCIQVGRQQSKRGVSMHFGPDVSKKFLDDNQLGMLCRYFRKVDQVA
jgi:serine/threonine-protein phosphatase 5